MLFADDLVLVSEKVEEELERWRAVTEQGVENYPFENRIPGIIPSTVCSAVTAVRRRTTAIGKQFQVHVPWFRNRWECRVWKGMSMAKYKSPGHDGGIYLYLSMIRR